jgi:gliding motility-associated-like protein
VEVSTICENNTTFSTEVEATAAPSVLIGIDTLRVCPGIIEQITPISYSGGISDIFWEFDGFDFSNEANPTVVSEDVPGDFVDTGLMMYVDVVGPCGTAQDSVFVLPTACALWSYNIITPNNDGYNDVFVIGGTNFYDNVELKVYNRWGGLVYEDADYQNDWEADGLESGTYYFIAVVPNGGPSLDGHFTIAR